MGNQAGYQQQQYYNPTAQRIPTSDSWLQNQTFSIKGDTYTLTDRRGGGTFGSVWASRTPNGRRAAVKVFDLRRIGGQVSPVALANSFKEEVRMGYRMRASSNYVVTIYGFDFDPTRRVALLAMELGDDSLSDRLVALHQSHPKRYGSGIHGNDYISATDRKNIWVQFVGIIMALQKHNIIHRDIKPGNLVFFGPILKIIDLGIATKAIRGHTTQSLGGTPVFSAPECLQGGAPITTKADIWSAGAILYCMTYGKIPKSETSQPPDGQLRTRSSLVHEVIDRCLQRNLSHRASHHWLAQHPLTTSSSVA